MEGTYQIIVIKDGVNKGCGQISPKFAKLSLLDPLFVYNPAKTILYYATDNIKDLIEVLKIREGSLKKHLHNGTVYLKSFTFSQNLLPNVEH